MFLKKAFKPFRVAFGRLFVALSQVPSAKLSVALPGYGSCGRGVRDDFQKGALAGCWFSMGIVGFGHFAACFPFDFVIHWPY